MARKKKESPLDKVFNDLGYDNPEEGSSITDIDKIPQFTQEDMPTDVDDLTEKTVDTLDEDDESKEGEDAGNSGLDDNTEIPEDVLNKIKQSEEDQQTIEEGDNDKLSEEVDPNEASAVGAFFDAFAESNGWDVPEDEKPKTIEEITDYIKDVVEQNSIPQYADDRIAQLDQYVKNGGKFEDFYQRESQRISYGTMDMDDEINQKAVVRDYLRISGYDEESINSKIEKYENAGLLEDEARDYAEQLQRIEEQQIKQLQQQQERDRQLQEQQAVEFAKNLNDSITHLDNIRGIKIPKEDRVALYNYVTKVDADGLTQYQKDFQSNFVNNLIESAYFTMKGDALLGEAKRSGQTDAASKLRTLLRHQTKNHSSFNADDKQRSVTDIASTIWR